MVCDGAWHTRSATVSIREGHDRRELRITAENGRWHENGHPNENVNGCIDIDLGWSPSTNTLPIRRLRLDVGKASGTIMAAWVRFPDLKLEPLPQQYVVEYEGLWSRVSQTK